MEDSKGIPVWIQDIEDEFGFEVVDEIPDETTDKIPAETMKELVEQSQA